MNKKRIWQIDFLRCLLAFCVIYIHCFNHFGYVKDGLSTLDLIGITFRMPFFMMISGFFSRFQFPDKVQATQYIVKRCMSLLVPYVTMLAISRFILVPFGFVDVIAWFLPTAMCNYLVTYLIINSINIRKRNLVLLVFVFILLGPIIQHLLHYIFPYPNFLYMFPFFCVGVILRRTSEWWMPRCKRIMCVAFVFYVVLLVFIMDESYNIPYGLDNWITYNGINLPLFLKCVVRFAADTSVCLLAMTCVQFFHNKMAEKISVFGKYKMQIYLSGLYLVSLFSLDITSYSIWQYGFGEEGIYSILCIIISLVFYVISIVMAKLFIYIPLLDFFVFGKSIYMDKVSHSIAIRLVK